MRGRPHLDHALAGDRLMPRAFAKVNVAIWQDPDFRRLQPAAQHLYLLLWTSPSLSFCGVHDWRPGRLSHLSEGFTEEHTRAVAACLTARHFIVIDHETEEVLIRSWLRFDEVLKQPRLAVSFVHAYADTYSATLRSVLIYELRKIREKSAGLSCWKDSRVADLLEHDAVSAKDLPTPEDPFSPELWEGFAPGFGLGLAQTLPKVSVSVSVPPTTATADADNTLQTEAADKPPAIKKSRQLPDDFRPTQDHVDLATSLGIDLRSEWPQFVDHHRSKGSLMKDWDAALRTWIRNAKKFGRATPNLVVVENLSELPPVEDSWMRRRPS